MQSDENTLARGSTEETGTGGPQPALPISGAPTVSRREDAGSQRRQGCAPLELHRWENEGGALRLPAGAARSATTWPRRVFRITRKIAIAAVGGTVLVIGVALIVLPGPAIVVLPLGLTILGAEFAWARRLLHRARSTAARAMMRVRRRPA